MRNIVRDKIMGRRYDGGKSPLGKPVDINGVLEDALRFGLLTDTVVTPRGVETTVADMKRMLKEDFNIETIEEYEQLPAKTKTRILLSFERKVRQSMKKRIGEPGKLVCDEEEVVRMNDRAILHRDVLTPWSRGELILEKPQASSLHHLVNYESLSGDQKSFLKDVDSVQDLIIEHNWAKALPPEISGEWRLPFEKCCWEFRISGVRVLAFTFAEDPENSIMVLTYGAKHIWCSDDYIYYLDSDGFCGKPNPDLGKTTVEFKEVAKLVWANIRAACIMLDAPNVCEHHPREPSRELVDKARREGTMPPRRHLVIRLMDMDRRIAIYRRIGGGKSGIRQGGHWRRATWVHYDDQDSGQVQYANDGGFIVSKTWRRWHFAGDPEHMVDKEYRL